MLRIDQIVKATAKRLDAFVRERKGTFHVAGDPWRPIELLAMCPPGFVCVLKWGGDDALGDAGADHVADQQLDVYVGYGMGLTAASADALFRNRVDRPSLLKLVDDVRAFVLAFEFPDEDTLINFEYDGTTEAVIPGGIPLAAYKIGLKLPAGIRVDDPVVIEIEQ